MLHASLGLPPVLPSPADMVDPQPSTGTNTAPPSRDRSPHAQSPAAHPLLSLSQLFFEARDAIHSQKPLPSWPVKLQPEEVGDLLIPLLKEELGKAHGDSRLDITEQILERVRAPSHRHEIDAEECLKLCAETSAGCITPAITTVVMHRLRSELSGRLADNLEFAASLFQLDGYNQTQFLRERQLNIALDSELKKLQTRQQHYPLRPGQHITIDPPLDISIDCFTGSRVNWPGAINASLMAGALYCGLTIANHHGMVAGVLWVIPLARAAEYISSFIRRRLFKQTSHPGRSLAIPAGAGSFASPAIKRFVTGVESLGLSVSLKHRDEDVFDLDVSAPDPGVHGSK